MLESFSEELEYIKLSPEEMQSRGILGRLKGVIADTKNPTRNGRLYSEELWDKTFDNPIMQEKIDNHCVFGELGHPTDRSEIDMEKIAICLAERPKKNKDGQLVGVFDILSTPNGRILKAMCDYGCNIGISSRGNGDTFTNRDGQEEVDPDTYECECWDAVLIPAVKEARLSLVNESIGKKTFKQALCEELNKANENDRKVMEETLKELDINVSETNEECNSEDCADKDEVSKVEAVGYAKVDSADELQEALMSKLELERKVVELNEKLSVGYAKEVKNEEELAKYRKAVVKLSESAKKVSALNEKVSKLTEELSKSNKRNSTLSERIRKLEEDAKLSKNKNSSLSSNLRTSSDKIKTLNENINSLSREKDSLNESIVELKKDLELKRTEYSRKIESSNKLVERYQKIASGAVSRYIESVATRIGVSANEIKNKLPDSYTFDDIDSICEELQSYKLTLNRLPFQTMGLNENIRASIKSSKNESLVRKEINEDDELDSSLLRIAGMG